MLIALEIAVERLHNSTISEFCILSKQTMIKTGTTYKNTEQTKMFANNKEYMELRVIICTNFVFTDDAFKC